MNLKLTEIVEGFTVMTYHLSKISHPEGDEIIFYYKFAGNYWYKTQITDNVYDFEWYTTNTNGPCSNDAVPVNPYPKAHRSRTFVSVVLDSIVATGYGKIVFETDNNRLDAPELRIKGLKIFKTDGEKIRAVELFHQFPYTTSYSNSVAIFENGSYDGDNVYYRMFLDAVVIKDNQENAIQRYSFEYKDLEDLPIRLSYSQDHWGYFNGANNNSLLPDDIPPSIKNTWFPGFSKNADRNPNEEYVQKGMLTRMNYPTGGYTLFEYESNRDLNANIHAGIRLLRQRNYNVNEEQTNLKQYSYSDASTNWGNGSISYFRMYSFETFCFDFGREDNIYGPFLNQYTVYWLSSKPLHLPSQVVYGKVTVHYDDNNQYGREEHEFETIPDGVDSSPSYGQLYGQFLPYPLELTNYGWKSGQKKQERYYSNDHLVKSIKYDYYEDPRIDLTKSYVTVQRLLEGTSGYSTHNFIGNYFNVMRYSVISKWNYLKTKTIKDYDLNGTNTVTTRIDYHYDNENHAQLTREVSTTSTEETIEKQRFYPQDYSQAGWLGTLADKFIINKAVDERTYKNNRLQSGSQIKYNDYGQPVDTYQAEISVWVPDIPFDADNPFTFTHKIKYQYNTDKLLISTHTDEGMSISYIWSYGKTLPVAKIENADYTEITLATANLGINFLSLLGNTIDQQEIDDNLAALRTEIESDLPNSPITTFTHYPLVGLRSSSDANGRTSYFEYDEFGRLSLVKDHDLNITKNYRYHYIPPSALPKLEVSPKSRGFDYNSTAKTFQIGSHAAWSISDDQNWIHVSPTSGNGDGTITITVDENLTFVDRTGTITIQDMSGHYLPDRKVLVNQQAHPNYVGISLVSMLLDYSSQNKTFAITSDVSWDITSSQSWISVTPGSGNGNSTITVTATQNDSFASRTAKLTIRDLSGHNSPDQFINIKQEGVPSYLNVSPTELHFETASGSKTFEVNSNVSWSVTDDQSWISVTPVSGSGNGTVSVTTTQNTQTDFRTGIVTITDQSGGGNIGQVLVIQPGTSDYITVSPTSFNFNGSTVDGEFDIFSDLNSWNTKINYISGNDWLDEIYPFSGFFNRSNIDVHVNQLPPSGQTWQAEIEVYNTSKGISTKIPVHVTN